MGVKSDAIERLFNAYGKIIKRERMHYYLAWADQLNAEMVSSIVDAIVKEESFFPTVNKLYSYSNDRVKVHKRDEPTEDCWFCDGIGQIPGIYKNEDGMWSHGIISACKCSSGRKSKYSPLIIFEHDARYLDLMKILKKNKDKAITPWGAVPYFYQELRAK